MELLTSDPKLLLVKSLHLSNSTIHAATAKHHGVIPDSSLSLRGHIESLSISRWLHLQNMPRIRLLISFSATTSAQDMHHLTLQQLPSSSPSLWPCLYPPVLGVVSTLGSFRHKSDYVTPLIKCQELPISFRIKVKMPSTVCQWGHSWSVHRGSSTSHYLSELLYHWPPYSACSSPMTSLLFL